MPGGENLLRSVKYRTKVMFKFILLVGFAAFALFWFASPPSAPPQTDMSSEMPLLANTAPTASQIAAIAKRRVLFCSMVEDVKRELELSATERERNLFDLAPNARRWDVLRSYMVERGSPEGSSLFESLGISAVNDIEFGTLDGSVPCSIPEEVGYVIKRGSR